MGSFFLPRDQQRPQPSRHTDYEGLAYLGEFPLAWAACCANESVYNLLLDNSADPDARDTFGNMILHMVVVCDKLDMFGYALRHPKVPASNGITNRSGLTPLTLACKLGRAEVFREMLELSAREFWRYSNITCSAYPLNALDTLLPDGRTNWNSALFIILNGTKEEHLDMLDGGIIQRLLEEKWKTFARRQFLKRLAILVLHLLLLSTAIYMRPAEQDEPLLGGREWHDIARYCAEAGTVCGVLSYVLLQQGGEIHNQGLSSFLKQLSHDPAKAIFLVSNLLILVCIPCRLTGDKRSEEAILLFAVPGSWFLFMFFAGAIRLTGPFVTMVYSMITGDMLTFGIIYMVVLFGFSQTFYFLYKGHPGVAASLYHSYPTTWMALFQITLGDYSYSDLSHTTYPNLCKTVFAIFMVFVPILLLNMLIAMMGNTYAHVIEQSEKEWMKQWAKIVVTLERAVNQADAHRYLQEYSISLGPAGDDPSVEQRGVMVIKSKSKTRAKQRKGAVANWKRVGKVTIRELHKRNMTGEQLRRLMWDRASISTPVRVPDSPEPGAEQDAGFGDNLMAALDVMAFTHDIDLSSAAAGALQEDSVPGQASMPAPPAVPAAPPTAAMPPAAGRAAGATARPRAEASAPPPLYPALPPRGEVDDPLRQLVLLSELPHMEQQLAALAGLAAQADSLEAVSPREQHRYCCLSLSEETRLQLAKADALLQPSDSDAFGDGPLLGRGSRSRRARASRRGGDPDRDALLFCHHKELSSSSSSDSGLANPGFAPSPPARAELQPEKTRSQPPHERSDKQPSARDKPRPKTARINRVGPSGEVPLRRGTSAAAVPSVRPPPSPPDPLDAWSTRPIANMNTLLSDEESM
ncbi:transient receptor potential cation channel subfamily V member 4 isoform X2 [Bacillus rossius redtenbacheri]|uniref:transient receptor potential cation channel subfamily V member 4 isoform X2 n=1 Tax=Bacillus rossius redtenbacheri TaxID=93214 RepID=UPI002FDE4EDC